MGVEDRANHQSSFRKTMVYVALVAEVLAVSQAAGKAVDNHAQRNVGSIEPTPKSCDDLSINERLGYPKGSNPFVEDVVPGTPVPCVEIPE